MNADRPKEISTDIGFLRASRAMHTVRRNFPEENKSFRCAVDSVIILMHVVAHHTYSSQERNKVDYSDKSSKEKSVLSFFGDFLVSVSVVDTLLVIYSTSTVHVS